MSLLSRLFHKKPADKKPEAKPASNLNTVSAPALAQLEQWSAKRQLIEVKVPGDRESYQSMVLAVDTVRGLVWLDELTPRPFSLGSAEWLVVEQHQNGEIITLRLPILHNADQRREIACLLPHSIDFRPRRRWERFTLPGDPLKAKIRSIGGEPQMVNIINLSAGGVRLALRGNQLDALRRDALLPLCEFTLGQLHINTHGRVKSARVVTSPYRHTQVSVEFADISVSTQRALNLYLLRLSDLQQNSGRSAA